MKVIREGKPQEVECKYCGSLLEYRPSDIKQEQTHINEYHNYVLCPVCKTRIMID